LYEQNIPQAAPAALDAMLLQLPTNDLYELVSQYGDEQMTVKAYFFVMIDRAVDPVRI
jgi:hypothetical protein